MTGPDPSRSIRTKVLREVLVLCGIGIIVAGTTLAIRTFRSMQEEVERLSVLAYEPHPGVFVPEITVEALDGGSAVLGKIGQRQLLFFFNTTCPHCRSSIPGWNEIAERLQTDSTFSLFGVAFDDPEMAEAYRDAQGIRFTVLPAPNMRVASLFRINAVPAVVLINPEGRIAYSRLGPMDGPASIDSVLAAASGITPPDPGGT